MEYRAVPTSKRTVSHISFGHYALPHCSPRQTRKAVGALLYRSARFLSPSVSSTEASHALAVWFAVAACPGHRASSSTSRFVSGGGDFSRCGYRRAAGGVRPRAIRRPWREISAALSSPAGCPLPPSAHCPKTKAEPNESRARKKLGAITTSSDWPPDPFSSVPADCTYATFVELEMH